MLAASVFAFGDRKAQDVGQHHGRGRFVTTLVLIPTYNERENLPALVRALLSQPSTRLLVIDDASPDGTGAVADELARASEGRLEVLHRTGPRGLGRSYLDGFRLALTTGADVVCQMDADLSHDPQSLPQLVSAAADAELVVGSRYVDGGTVVNWPAHRLALSAFANAYVRTITRLPLRDCTSGYRCWRRAGLAALPLDRIRSEGYAFLVETAFHAAAAGLRTREVPITFVERRAGASKLSWSVVVESALEPWRLRGRHGRIRS